jgi:hypothetical protein
MIEIKNLLLGMTLKKLPVGSRTIRNPDRGGLRVSCFRASDFSL